VKTWIIAALAQIASMFDPVDPDPQVAVVAHLQFYGELCAMMGYDYQELKSPALDKEFTAVRPDLETEPGAVALRMGRALMQLRLQSQYDVFTPSYFSDARSDAELAAAALKTMTKPKAVCAALAEDSFTSRFVRRLPEAEFLKAQTEFDDSFLRLLGKASWQSPNAPAALDLGYRAGFCAVVVPHGEIAAALALAESAARQESRPVEALKLVRDRYEWGERSADRSLPTAGCRKVLANAKARVGPPKAH